jgi:arylsulfatase A-like enzyme
MFDIQRMCVWLLVVTGVLAFAPNSLADRPNILFIFSDDHARAAISAYGSNVNQTPHLDKLASKGAKFLESYVTNSICTPSRATLLTGQYSHLNGVPVFNRFDGSRDHVAKHLQKNGYHTGMIGKWHLGSNPTGFDRWIVLPGQGSYVDPAFITPQGRVTIAGHCTEVTTELGIEFLENRPKDKPFFLMLHHKAPHRAWDPDEKNKALFASKQFAEPKTLFDDYKTRPAALPENEQTVAKDLTRRDLKLVPPEGLTQQQRNAWLNEKPMQLEVNGKMLEGKDLVRWKYQRYMQDYLACVQGVDDSVGQVMEYLKANDLEKNTIVIYTADNGWYLGELGLYDKRFMYEPGLRTPLLAAGPGIRAGVEPSAMVANIDIAPTLLDLAGIPIPDFMQGVSFKPLLQGETPAKWRKSVYYRYYHSPGHHNTQAHYGVRTESHKLIYYWNKDLYELYDLKADPEEQNNLMFEGVEKLSQENKKLFEALKNEISRLQTEYRDDGQYANASDWPKGGVDGPFDQVKMLGRKTIAEAFSLTKSPTVSKAELE